MQPKPFTINIPKTMLDDLKSRLQNTRWPDAADGWGSGTSREYMEELVDYWQHKYDWRKAETKLNTLPQFTVNIGDTDLHFVHQKSEKPNAPALLLAHGWPDTFQRFVKVVPMLAKEFNVIVPSMPGFGFSSRNTMADTNVADLYAKLMTNILGYKTIMAAGGDLGTGVIKALAHNHADITSAVHLTDAGYPTGQEDPSTLSKAVQDFINQAQWWSMSEGAYLFINGNKPQSVAYAFNDSPAGLAAWIISFVNGGNEKSYADKAFGGRDELLTNIMIYWLTETAGSSARMYRTNALATYGGGWDGAPNNTPAISKVPAAFAMFPGELQIPRDWAERDLTVKRFTKMEKGGHFAAIEVPELYATDIIESYKELTAQKR